LIDVVIVNYELRKTWKNVIGVF